MKKELEFEALAMIDEDTAYASSRQYNALFKVDIHTFDCEYITCFDDEPFEKTSIHSKAIFFEEKVYFIPSSGDSLHIFDVTNKGIQTVSIPRPKIKQSSYKKRFKFVEAIIWSDCLYMIPSSYPGIIRVTLDTNDLFVIDDWLPTEGFYFRKGLCIRENRCFVPSANNDCVLEFNLEREKGKIHHHKYNCGFWGMCDYKGSFWLSPRNDGPVISWDPDTGETEKYENYPEGFVMNGKPFTKIYEKNGMIYILPEKANQFIIYRVEDKRFETYSQSLLDGVSSITFLTEIPSGYYIKLCGREIYGVLNTEENKFHEKAFLLGKNQEGIYDYIKKGGRIFYEGKLLCVEDFIKEIVL